jgi:hypothetical protein
MMSDYNIIDFFMKYLLHILSIGGILFVIYLAYVILCAILFSRGIRRKISADLNPVFSFKWNGHLDILRDKIIENLKNQSSNHSLLIFEKSNFRRPSVAVSVLGHKGQTTKSNFIGILIRKNKTNVCMELRSCHPLWRPSKKICREVLLQIEKGIISNNDVVFNERFKK